MCSRKISVFVYEREQKQLSTPSALPHHTHTSSNLECSCDDWRYSNHLATMRVESKNIGW